MRANIQNVKNYKDIYLNKQVGDTIKKHLFEMYPPIISIDEPFCKTREGIVDVFEVKKGQRWSILNYMDTNHFVKEELFKYFLKNIGDNPINLKNFLTWITKYKDRLFKDDTSEAKNLRTIIVNTQKKGYELEKKTLNKLKKILKVTDEDIIEYCPGSKEDETGGVDFIIKNRGYQLKSLIDFRKKDEKWYITTKGMSEGYLKKPKVEFIIYSNDNQILIFPNSNYRMTTYGGRNEPVEVEHSIEPHGEYDSELPNH